MIRSSTWQTNRKWYIHSILLQFQSPIFFPFYIIEWRFFSRKLFIGQRSPCQKRSQKRTPQYDTRPWCVLVQTFSTVSDKPPAKNSPKTNPRWSARPTLTKFSSNKEWNKDSLAEIATGVNFDRWLVVEWRRWRIHLINRMLKCGWLTFLTV